MNNTHDVLTDLPHTRAIAEMICLGFEINYDAITVSDHPRRTVVDLTTANYPGKVITIHPNAYVAMPDDLPAEVYAGLDLDLRTYYADNNLTPIAPN
jgi:hypothetical protein